MHVGHSDLFILTSSAQEWYHFFDGSFNRKSLKEKEYGRGESKGRHFKRNGKTHAGKTEKEKREEEVDFFGRFSSASPFCYKKSSLSGDVAGIKGEYRGTKERQH